MVITSAACRSGVHLALRRYGSTRRQSILQTSLADLRAERKRQFGILLIQQQFEQMSSAITLMFVLA